MRYVLIAVSMLSMLSVAQAGPLRIRAEARAEEAAQRAGKVVVLSDGKPALLRGGQLYRIEKDSETGDLTVSSKGLLAVGRESFSKPVVDPVPAPAPSTRPAPVGRPRRTTYYEFGN
jgi:hypothetical protein